MKRSLLIATGLVLLSTSANATKSRMTALGQDENRGSYYIDDTRNVFKNAAYAGTTSNYVVTEWGGTGTNAEGGFFKELGAFSYGAYFNGDANSQNGLATASTTTGYGGGTTTAWGNTSFADRSDNLDVFIAGDMGFQWGARLSYAAANNKQATFLDATYKGLGLGLGVIFGDVDFSVNYVLSDDYENLAGSSTAGVKNEGSGMDIVAGYKMGAWKFFGSYQTKGLEYVSGTGVAKNETTQTKMVFGAGHTHEVSSTARLYSDLSYSSTKGEDKDGTTAANNQEKTATSLKLNVAFEADATSWLTWRGGLNQNFLVDKVETKVGAATSEVDGTSASVYAGATLNFGKLKVDGSIGGGTATGALSDNLQLDTLLANVAVHYWF